MKGLALAILLTMQVLSKAEIDRLYNKYQWKNEDQGSVTSLKSQGSKVSAGIGIDIMLALLLVASVVINCATVGKPLTQRRREPARTYGELPSSEQNTERMDD